MNANEMSPKANARLKQIMAASRTFKIIFLIAAIVFGAIGILSVVTMMWMGNLNPIVMHNCTLNLSYFGYAVTSWFAYQLFSAYASGNLFAPTVVCRIRWLGIGTVLVGIVNGGIHMLMLVKEIYQAGASVPMGLAISVPLIEVCIQIFFNVVPGLAIIFIAWVMDEGRKIQEEQELTV
jgi:hypothetical protein